MQYDKSMSGEGELINRWLESGQHVYLGPSGLTRKGKGATDLNAIIIYLSKNTLPDEVQAPQKAELYSRIAHYEESAKGWFTLHALSILNKGFANVGAAKAAKKVLTKEDFEAPLTKLIDDKDYKEAEKLILNKYNERTLEDPGKKIIAVLQQCVQHRENANKSFFTFLSNALDLVSRRSGTLDIPDNFETDLKALQLRSYRSTTFSPNRTFTVPSRLNLHLYDPNKLPQSEGALKILIDNNDLETIKMTTHCIADRRFYNEPVLHALKEGKGEALTLLLEVFKEEGRTDWESFILAKGSDSLAEDFQKIPPDDFNWKKYWLPLAEKLISYSQLPTIANLIENLPQNYRSEVISLSLKKIESGEVDYTKLAPFFQILENELTEEEAAKSLNQFFMKRKWYELEISKSLLIKLLDSHHSSFPQGLAEYCFKNDITPNSKSNKLNLYLSETKESHRFILGGSEEYIKSMERTPEELYEDLLYAISMGETKSLRYLLQKAKSAPFENSRLLLHHGPALMHAARNSQISIEVLIEEGVFPVEGTRHLCSPDGCIEQIKNFDKSINKKLLSQINTFLKQSQFNPKQLETLSGNLNALFFELCKDEATLDDHFSLLDIPSTLLNPLLEASRKRADFPHGWAEYCYRKQITPTLPNEYTHKERWQSYLGSNQQIHRWIVGGSETFINTIKLDEEILKDCFGYALKNAQTDSVSTLLKRAGAIDTFFWKNGPELLEAAYKVNRVDVLRALMEHGVLLSDGSNLMEREKPWDIGDQFTSHPPDEKMCQLLCEYVYKNNEGENLFELALQTQNEALIKTLSDHQLMDSTGHSILHYIVREPDHFLTNLNRLDENLLFQPDSSGVRLIDHLVKSGNREQIRAFISWAEDMFYLSMFKNQFIGQDGHEPAWITLIENQQNPFTLLEVLDIDEEIFLKNYKAYSDSNGGSVFHLAARFGNDEALIPLLSDKDTMLAKDNNGDTFIHIALKNKQQAFAQAVYLLTKDKNLINSKDRNGNSCFHNEILRGESAFFTWLQSQEEMKNEVLKEKNREGNTSVHLIANSSTLVNGKKPTFSDENRRSLNLKQQNPLHLFCQNRQADKAALSSFWNTEAVQFRDQYGYTPIHYAYKTNHPLLPLLLKRCKKEGIDIEQFATPPFDGNTLFHFIVASSNVSMLKSLNPSPEELETQNNDGDSPLVYAARSTDFTEKMALWMLDKAAPSKQELSKALKYTIQSRSINVTRLLMQRLIEIESNLSIPDTNTVTKAWMVHRCKTALSINELSLIFELYHYSHGNVQCKENALFYIEITNWDIDHKHFQVNFDVLPEKNPDNQPSLDELRKMYHEIDWSNISNQTTEGGGKYTLIYGLNSLIHLGNRDCLVKRLLEWIIVYVQSDTCDKDQRDLCIAELSASGSHCDWGKTQAAKYWYAILSGKQASFTSTTATLQPLSMLRLGIVRQILVDLRKEGYFGFGSMYDMHKENTIIENIGSDRGLVVTEDITSDPFKRSHSYYNKKSLIKRFDAYYSPNQLIFYTHDLVNDPSHMNRQTHDLYFDLFKELAPVTPFDKEAVRSRIQDEIKEAKEEIQESLDYDYTFPDIDLSELKLKENTQENLLTIHKSVEAGKQKYIQDLIRMSNSDTHLLQLIDEWIETNNPTELNKQLALKQRCIDINADLTHPLLESTLIQWISKPQPDWNHLISLQVEQAEANHENDERFNFAKGLFEKENVYSLKAVKLLLESAGAIKR